MIEVVGSSETLTFYRTARCHITHDSNLEVITQIMVTGSVYIGPTVTVNAISKLLGTSIFAYLSSFLFLLFQ
jgi:hypothetical protein